VNSTEALKNLGGAVTALIEAKNSELNGSKGAGGKITQETQLAIADQVWRNNGWLDPEERYKYREGHERESHRVSYDSLVEQLDIAAGAAKDAGLKDALELTSAVILIPKVITKVVREAAEPILALTPLMRRINFSAGESITFPATGCGMWAEDIPPGGEYPEQHLEFAGYVTANIGKSGLKVHITEEMIRYSMYDVMAMHVQAGSRALARHKEKKVALKILSQGRVIFDNDNPGASVYGTTSGRNLSALFNKTVTLDDIFMMFAELLNAGYIPTDILMNPWGWLIFARDGTMRAFGFMNNGALWQRPQGQPGQGPAMPSPNMGPGVGQDPSQVNPQASTYSPVPGMLPIPLGIIASPFIPFDPSTKKTSLIMADRMELGIIVVDEDPVTESWNDPKRDIRSTKIRERYGLAIDNMGQAIAVAKNVRVDRNYDWEENIGLSWSAGSGALPTGFQAGI